MLDFVIKRLTYLCEIIPPLLANIGEPLFSTRPDINKWSKKEIIGHLIDSATNNHQRFIRAQFELCPLISYDQNKWNQFNFYQHINGEQVILFWTVYNKQLIELFKQIPEESLKLECKTTPENSLTIDFLINDYLEHLEYHLRQVVNYPPHNAT
ncbi:DinB family protein [Arcticibacter sp.]|jgi:hypothetical protein|uniref:DinB family protein n=1 Tax=Arcticibacter sp. TaxID=1872630 RepID=UPI0038904C90